MPFKEPKFPKSGQIFLPKQFASARPQASEFEKLRFVAEDSRITVSNVELGAKWAAGLVMLFSILDYLVYPEHANEFLVLRVVCSCMVLLIAHLCKSARARRQYRVYAFVVQFTVAVFMALMVYLLEEPGTTYYAGLTLCIVGTASVVQLTLRETMLACGLIFTLFLVATFPHLERPLNLDSFRQIASDCFFLISTAILVVVVAFNQNNFRYGEFVARTRLRNHQAELEIKNKELKETMQNLHETEKQLFQSEKMALLGQLSAGVIHEIANPLNFTNNALFVLRKKTKNSGDDVGEIIADMQEGIDRIRGIITDLREFSHAGGDIGEVVTVADIVESSSRLLNKPLIEGCIDLSIDIDKDLKIVAVKNQLIQVFSNLIHNSIQAMADLDRKGQIHISAKVVDKNIEVVVEDNGCGISEEDREKLFDLFFTTKAPGEGTGMGLSISFRIIEAHGGKIDVESTTGERTAFTITVPRAIV